MSTSRVLWDPLPPRKRQRIPVGDPAALSEATVDTAVEKNVDLADAIAQNIAERAKINRSQTTLESKDGCGTENYEYLDHTADVQCHAWGSTMVEAFEKMAECLLNYMTDINLIEIDEVENQKITIQGHDLDSLLYNYMNELLFRFITDSFCTKKVTITNFNRDSFSLDAIIQGDIYDPSKHSCGTEIKAITYSNMQIHEKQDRVDLFVIVDI